jgi:hypothetical protein
MMKPVAHEVSAEADCRNPYPREHERHPPSPTHSPRIQQEEGIEDEQQGHQVGLPG